jgi:hypothetical protein
MLRKLSLVAVAAASLGAAALAPTSASAWGGWHNGGWHHHGWGWGGPRVVVAGPAYYGGGYVSSYVRLLFDTTAAPPSRLVNRSYTCSALYPPPITARRSRRGLSYPQGTNALRP